MGCPKRLAITAAIGGHLHDPAGADPGFANVLRCLFRTQRPGDVAAVAVLVIRCLKRDLGLELAADLAVQRLLIGLDCQEEVRPPAPRAAEKRALGLECVRLAEHALEIQLAKQLAQHRPLVVFAGGIAGPTDRHTEADEYSVTWAMNAEQPPAVGSIEPLMLLPSHAILSRSIAPLGIWAIVQSQIAL